MTQGKDINALDRHGQTTLMLAARDGRRCVVSFLIGRGAALDIAAKYRLTALMLAVLNDRTEIVRELVKAGADRRLQGAGVFKGQTALDLARAAGKDEMIDLLRPSGQ